MISPVPHGDLTPKNILVDGNGNLKLTSISLARLSLNLPASDRRTLFGEDTTSARYMSPELLQDEARPTPESDMWAFGNVAFWIFSGLMPYPDHQDEMQVIAQITKGLPPNGPNQLERLEELGGTPVPEDSLWQTNGVWSSILRCWDVTARKRLTATRFLHELENRSDMSERPAVFRRWDIAGITDLTGRIRKSETSNYGLSLGWSRGVWRGAYDGRGIRTTYITLWCWKTTLSQGFFRSSLEVVVKGVQLTPKNSTTYAARQSIRHQLLLLKQIRHDNICPLLGFDQQYMEFSGVPGIVLEFCSNGTLQEYYAQKFHELDLPAKVDLIKDLGEAIHYLHHEISQGVVVHGNLSMETILVDAKGTLKLSNFEFACQYAHADNALEAPVIFAPPLAPPPSRWHAPEFFEGPTDAGWPNPTQFSDLWSLGCLVVAVSSNILPISPSQTPRLTCDQIWMNKLPFADYDSPGALSQIVSGTAPYSQEDSSPEVLEIATLLWAKPHYDRISTTRFAEMVQALGE
ncbi:Retinal guanylyl cyclase 2 [Ceratobasidium sp. 414]|nr:Retinal guanylyl cyclase 2 [Ceratobasidium sp. 414]